MLKEFIKRNSPVFFIGGITFLVFIGIILVSQKKPPVQPELVQVNESDLITDHSYYLGPNDAPVTLVEFSDFQCPACRSAEVPIKTVLDQNKDYLKFVYRNMPLNGIHPYAQKAAEAAQAAGAQGKFWEYHDILFANQDKLEIDDLVNYAGQLGMDTEQFRSDLTNGKFAGEVSKDVADGKSFGISGTPTFFLNGKKMEFSTYQDFVDQVNAETSRYKDSASSIYSKYNLDKIDELYGKVEFIYTDGKFVPETAEAHAGQVVSWINPTPNPIILTQTSGLFRELDKDITIEASSSFDFRVYGSGELRFIEKNALKTPSILTVSEYQSDLN